MLERRSVGQSGLLPGLHLGPKARYLLLSDSCQLVDVGALSDEKAYLSFTIAAGPRQRSHSRVRVPQNSRPYFVASDSRAPLKTGAPDPHIYILRDRVAPFGPLLLLSGLRWRYSNPPPHFKLATIEHSNNGLRALTWVHNGQAVGLLQERHEYKHGQPHSAATLAAGT
jgi:hypothetical protein